MDTVRADRVAGYGDARTPTLATIAREGQLFRDFYAASSYTLPSHGSIFTGLDPIEHGLVNVLARLDPDVETLGSWLAAAGYRTQAFQEGDYVDARYGFDRGFGEAYEKRGFKQVVGESLWGILDWIKAAGDEPYFLFLHTYAAHYPYGGFERYRREHPERGLPDDAALAELKRRYPPIAKTGPASRDLPAELRNVCTLYNELAHWNREWLACGDNMFHAAFMETPHFEQDRAAMRRSYDRWIGRIDRTLRRIRKTLVARGLWRDTLLIVTADHGEAFFEHGLEKHDYVPFNEVMKVPLIVSWPAGLPAGREIAGLAWHLDLAPTILSLAGVPIPAQLRGLDLAPVLRGEKRIPEQRAVFPLLLRPANRMHLPPRRMLVRGRFKYIRGHEAFGDPDGLLFDLEASPDETENLRERRPDLARELEAEIEAWEDQLVPGRPIHQQTGERISPFPNEVSSPYDLPESEQEWLHQLGYL